MEARSSSISEQSPSLFLFIPLAPPRLDSPQPAVSRSQAVGDESFLGAVREGLFRAREEQGDLLIERVLVEAHGRVEELEQVVVDDLVGGLDAGLRLRVLVVLVARAGPDEIERQLLVLLDLRAHHLAQVVVRRVLVDRLRELAQPGGEVEAEMLALLDSRLSAQADNSEHNQNKDLHFSHSPTFPQGDLIFLFFF